MINRDFSKSGKEYIKKNKFVLIALGFIVALGVIMLSVFGFNGGADVKGYNTFSIKMGTSYEAKNMGDYTDCINTNLATHDADLISVQLTGEGDVTTLVVKYNGSVKDFEQLNKDLAKDLNISPAHITEHSEVGASLTNKDYIYAFACGLIIITLASIYIACRYNLACTMTAIISSILSVLLLMSVVGIFRLTVNNSFLAINILTILLVLGECFIMFDGLEKARYELKDKNDRSTQLTNTMKANSFRQKLMYGAIFAMALIFIVLMPNTIKQASLIVLFATVITLFTTIYALPFLWSLTITQISDRIRVKKEKKVKTIQASEEVEGEIEEKYTENQVIEVKEDSGEETPSTDDNVTIE
ncbi:MAG: hypothetical protein J6Q15_00720 [Clostridia bacterium]|nr:hypothetical protein [Clostridia bacterium]